jgi:predicted DNA-binding ribbon-helix-helix protein
MTRPDGGPPEKRSLTLAGHRTSVTLEPVFWAELRRIAEREGASLNAFAARIDAARDPDIGLASALRVAVLRDVLARKGQQEIG